MDPESTQYLIISMMFKFLIPPTRPPPPPPNGDILWCMHWLFVNSNFWWPSGLIKLQYNNKKLSHVQVFDIFISESKFIQCIDHNIQRSNSGGGGGVSSINTMLFYFCREIELMSLLLIPKINKMQLLHEYFYYTYPYLPKFKYKQCRVWPIIRKQLFRSWTKN